MPYALADGRWDDEEPRCVRHLIDIADRFAPGFRDSVVDVFALTPPGAAQPAPVAYAGEHTGV